MKGTKAMRVMMGNLPRQGQFVNPPSKCKPPKIARSFLGVARFNYLDNVGEMDAHTN